MDTITKSASTKTPAGSDTLAPAYPILLTRSDVHAQLGEIIAGMKCGRSRDDEIIVFDSSGTALQDVAAAVVVYRRVVGRQRGLRFSFNV